RIHLRDVVKEGGPPEQRAEVRDKRGVHLEGGGQLLADCIVHQLGRAAHVPAVLGHRGRCGAAVRLFRPKGSGHAPPPSRAGMNTPHPRWRRPPRPTSCNRNDSSGFNFSARSEKQMIWASLILTIRRIGSRCPALSRCSGRRKLPEMPRPASCRCAASKNGAT